MIDVSSKNQRFTDAAFSSPTFAATLLFSNIFNSIRHLFGLFLCKFKNMKKIILLIALVLSSALYKVANAQVGVTVNIGNQPVWGPTGYDYAEYYYFPDMDVYYHIPDRQFIYFDRGRWISAYSLPSFYRNYDLYRSYKVVINEPNPFMRNDYWRSRYSSYRGRPQEIIYNSREPKYFVINEHPEHSRWMASRSNNDRRYNDNRAGNYERNDDRRYDNSRRSTDVVRNDRDRNDRDRNNNNGRINDIKRSNENDQRGNWNGRYNGRRN